MKKAKRVVWIFTLVNLALLIFGMLTHPVIVVPLFLAVILQFVLIAFLKISRLVDKRNTQWPDNQTAQNVIEIKLTEFQRQINYTYNRIEALLSIHQLFTFRQPLPVMSDWAIASDYGYVLVQQILQKPEGDILDIGSGITTLLAGYAVEKRGHGKVISLEHDEAYFNVTQQLIRHHKLEHVVELHYCPLVEHTIQGEKRLWYDVSAVKNLAAVNLISVDGPPEKTQSLARYPMAPVILPQVSAEVTILLDDSARPDEKRIAERWKNEYALNTEYVNLAKGLYIFNRKEAVRT